jgi:glycosyltransferase involved in cell wall biosynthesis
MAALKPRVLVVSALSLGTGSGLRARYLAGALSRLGWEARLAAPAGGPLPYSGEILAAAPSLALRGLGRFDLAVGVKPYPNVCLALALARLRGALAVVDVDDADGAYRGAWLGGLTRLLQAPAFRVAQMVSTHHPLLRQVLARHVNADRMLALPQGVDLGLFDAKARRADAASWRRRAGLDGRVLLGFTAHLNVACQLDLLLELAGPWLRRHPEATLVVAGGGPLLERFRALAAPLGPRVRFEGQQTPLQAATTLAACDVAVSVYGQSQGNQYRVPMKVAESLALGRPVVSNLIPGLLPLQSFLVKAKPEPASFGRALDTALARGLPRARKGRDYVRRQLDWTKVTAAFLDQIRQRHPALPRGLAEA